MTRTARWVLLPLIAALPPVCLAAACGSTGSGGASSGDAGTFGGADGNRAASCASSVDCASYTCTCVDGTTTGGDLIPQCVDASCETGESFCSSMCASHGGTRSVVVQPNVDPSPECNAFCQRIAAMTCSPDGGVCDRNFYCRVNVDAGGCQASTLAQLRCETDSDAWACGPNGSIVISADCPPRNAACGDSGAGE